MCSAPAHEFEVFNVRSQLYLPYECESSSLLSKDCAPFLVDATERALESEDHIREIFRIRHSAENFLSVLAWLSALHANVRSLLDTQCVRVLANALQGDLDKYERELYWAAVTCYQITAFLHTTQQQLPFEWTQIISSLFAKYYRF